MAILGQIRKRSIFLIIVIGMALFAFVLSGVFTSNGGFGANEPIGEINGEEIDYAMFNMMVEQAQTVYGLNMINAVNLAWNQGLKNQALIQEIDKLGIGAGRGQLEQIISSDESIVMNPLFQNEIGLFDFNKFSSYITQLNSSNPTMYDQWRLQEQNIISLAKQKIYFDLIKSSVIYTNVESNIQYHLENDKVSIEYLRIPYEIIPDSTLKIKDSEILSYLKKNRGIYENGESRKVEYIYIPDVASNLDENNIRTNLEQLRDGFSQMNQVTNSIEEIKGLINVEENINTTYKHFKELQERWRNAGPIPRDKYNNAWNSYHHHVEIFYDFLHEFLRQIICGTLCFPIGGVSIVPQFPGCVLKIRFYLADLSSPFHETRIAKDTLYLPSKSDRIRTERIVLRFHDHTYPLFLGYHQFRGE